MNEQFDTSTANGEAMLKIILIFAELERNMTSERNRNHAGSRGTGLVNLACRSYRWNRNQIRNRIKKKRRSSSLWFDEYERVRFTTKILDHLNTIGYSVEAWRPVDFEADRDIIRNPFYIGTYRYNLREWPRPMKPESEWIVRENNHPAIIAKEQFDRCNAIMDENGFSRDVDLQARKYVHTFSGRLVCGSAARI